MRAYELMIIFDGDVDESPLPDATSTRIARQVEAGGGRIATTDRWGRRRFAYEINHKCEGIYVVLEIVTEAADLDDARAHPAPRGRGRPPQAHPPARQRGRSPRPARRGRPGRGRVGRERRTSHGT